MVLIGIFRIIFVKQWKALLSKHIQEIPFLFSLLALSQKYFLSTEGFILNEFMLLVRRTVQKWIVFPIEYAVFF